MRNGRRCLGCGTVAMAAAACSSPTLGAAQPNPDAQTCPASTQQALINGTPDESFLGLSDAQRNAIVQVVEGTRRVDGPFCSGAFVARDWVVTARHCLVIPSPVVVVGGSVSGTQVVLSVTRSMGCPFADVAVLQVDLASADAGTAIDAGPFGMAPLGVASTAATSLVVGDVVELAGYGFTEMGDTRDLRFLAESIVSIDDRTIRVDGFGANGACDGDSGGPLLARNADGAVVVAGVLWAGSSDCREQDQYTRLDAVRDWVTGIIGPGVSADQECGSITEQGRCLYGSALWCSGNQLAAERCVDGKQCGWDAANAGFRCVDPGVDPCGGVDATGVCRDNEALACNGGVLMRDDCMGCQVCRVAGRTGHPECMAGP